MSLKNVFEIDVDIKSKTAIKPVTVTQNDTVIFIFKVFDEGRIYNIEDGTTFTLTSTRQDKQAVMAVGNRIGTNIVEFELGTTEIAIPGKVDAVIQVYDANGRVSTIPFKYEVLSDPSTDYIPSEDEETLIQKVLGEGPAILADAQQATTDADTAATNANNAAQEATEAIQGVAQAVNDAETAATLANEKAALADEKATLANNAAQGANTAKTSAETATQAAQEATQAINLILPNVEGLEYIAPYDPDTAYVKNNIIRLGKNSYIALQNTQGNAPTGNIDSPYWGVLALGGIDGTGSVVSVNGIGPDENGNVTIEIPNPDLSGLATKAELENHLKDFLPHNSGLSQYASNPDVNEVYTVIDFKRDDNTLYLKSTASNPDGDGNYQTITWQFYKDDGSTVSKTATWSLAYDENGVPISKAVTINEH